MKLKGEMEQWVGPDGMNGDVEALIQHANWLPAFRGALSALILGGSRGPKREMYIEAVAYSAVRPHVSACAEELDQMTEGS